MKERLGRMGMKATLQKSMMWAVVLSEASHIFCCVFPTLFSVVGLLAGLGMVVALPGFMIELHNFLHNWEVPMIALSGAILVLGWVVTLYSEKIDCHDGGCGHGACAPRKKRAHVVLKIATVLFVFNVLIYMTIHRSTWFITTVAPAAFHQHHEGGGH